MRWRCATLMADAGAVVHLAAQTAVTTSLTDPVQDFEVNARGTLNVLEAVRAAGHRPPVVFASTNKVYGALEDLEMVESGDRHLPADARIRARGIGEDRPLDFCTPYGCSKGVADQYVLDYAKSYGIPATVLRMSCIYGPRQFGTEDQGWVAHFLIRALEGAPITVYGDGKQMRDVLHVADAVAAYRVALERIGEVSGRAFNLGGGPRNAVSLRMVLDEIARLTGRPCDVSFHEWRQGDQFWFVADTRGSRRRPAGARGSAGARGWPTWPTGCARTGPCRGWTPSSADHRVMRVLMTLDAVGGVWRYGMDLADGLARRGHRLIFAGFGPPPSPGQRAEAEALGVLDWCDAPLEWMVADAAELTAVPGIIAACARRHRADLLHLNMPGQAAGLDLALPLVVASHSCVPDLVRGGEGHGPAAGLGMAGAADPGRVRRGRCGGRAVPVACRCADRLLRPDPAAACRPQCQSRARGPGAVAARGGRRGAVVGRGQGRRHPGCGRGAMRLAGPHGRAAQPRRTACRWRCAMPRRWARCRMTRRWRSCRAPASSCRHRSTSRSDWRRSRPRAPGCRWC